jgi:CheY-like chemotaxis protein
MVNRTFTILLVEDDEADVGLFEEALSEVSISVDLKVVNNGIKAKKYLLQEDEYSREPLPDMIILDLNLPRKNSRELLAEIKNEPYLKSIPVIIFTTSDLEEDVLKCYNAGANCYITKPSGLNTFFQVVESLCYFWLTTVKLPPRRF